RDDVTGLQRLVMSRSGLAVDGEPPQLQPFFDLSAVAKLFRERFQQRSWLFDNDCFHRNWSLCPKSPGRVARSIIDVSDRKEFGWIKRRSAVSMCCGRNCKRPNSSCQPRSGSATTSRRSCDSKRRSPPSA